MSTDLGETEEGILLAAAIAGDKNPVSGVNISEACKSCGTKIEQIYCGNCGQKNDDLRRSLWRLIGESLGGLFVFESRMWCTWGALLLKPGKVAHAYANGARTIYSPPMRVYLVVSFMFFGFLAVTQTNLFALSIQPKEKVEGLVSEDVISESSLALFNDYSVKPLFFQSQKTFERLSDDTITEGFLRTIQSENTSEDTDEDTSAQEEPLKAFQIFLKNPKKFNTAFNT